MGRGKNDGRSARRKNNAKVKSNSEASPEMQRAADMFGATAMPDDVNPNDVALFYQIIASQSWEEVEGKIMQVVELGLLSEGLLLAGFEILEKAKASNEDPRTVNSITNVVKRMTQLLQELKASPVLQLVDEWVKILDSDPAKGSNQVKEKMQAVFKEGKICTQESFDPEIKNILQMMEDQNKQFEESVRAFEQQSETLDPEKASEIEESRRQRASAVVNVSLLKDLAASCTIAVDA